MGEGLLTPRSIAGSGDGSEAPGAGGNAQGLFYVPYLGDSARGSWSPGFARPVWVDLAAGLLPEVDAVADPAPVGLRRRYRVRVGPGKVRVASSATGSEQDRPVALRGEVTSWSSRSRLNMVETMASLDWGPVLEPGRPGWRPAMVTLTLPRDWLAVAPDGPAFKRLLDRLRRRWDRRWGDVAWVWKLEFQRRGAPHVHLYLAVGPGRDFAEWLSLAWTCAVFGLRVKRGEGESWGELVARVRGRYGDAVGDHLQAGTGIDWAEGIRASDPKRLAVYFLKRATGHNVGARKEYQHRVPAEWAGSGPGRFWGYRGLERCDVEVEVAADEWYRLRRLLRRWARANGRPVSALGGAHGIGGMVLANDAPTLLAQAARGLEVMRDVGEATGQTVLPGAAGRGRGVAVVRGVRQAAQDAGVQAARGGAEVWPEPGRGRGGACEGPAAPQ